MRNRDRSNRRLPVAAIVVVTLLGLLAIPIGAFAALQATGVDGPSPAQGHAQIIAQGVSTMPADRVAWRVSTKTADTIDNAPLEKQLLGFVYANTDAVVVNDYDQGTQKRLAGGEAAFVQSGASQQRASLTGSSASYFGISLVSEDQAPNPDNVFDAPSGSRDIDLLKDVLGNGEQTSITGSGFPILIFAVNGKVDVTVSGNTTTLSADQAGVFSGDLTVAGKSGDGSTFLAGIIGPEVPPAPRFSGTVSVALFGCPAGVTTTDLPAAGSSKSNPCTALDNAPDVTLTGSDGKPLSLGDATTDSSGASVWKNLAFGDYTLKTSSDLPDGYTDVSLVDSDGNLVSDGAVTLSRDKPDAVLAFYFLKSSGGTATIQVFNCPPGMDADTLVGSACEQVTQGFDVTLSSDSLTNGDLTLDDATASSDGYSWTDLPVTGADGSGSATFTISETMLPAGYDSFTIAGASGGGSDPWTFALSSDQPIANLSIYNLEGLKDTGIVTLDVLECPSATSDTTDCARASTFPTLTGISITAPSGTDTLTEDNASQVGDSPLYWADLPFGSYSMDTSSLVPPDGYEIIGIELTPDGSDPGAGFTMSADIPAANIVVLLAPIDQGATPTALQNP